MTQSRRKRTVLPKKCANCGTEAQPGHYYCWNCGKQLVDDPLKGRTLGKGEFKIRDKLGRGEQGAVYRAWQHSLQREVALKVLPSYEGIDQKEFERFKRSTLASGKLDHDNIVPVYTAGQDQGYHYVAMRLVDGESLKEVLEREEKLSPDEVSNIARQVLEGLKEAHREGLIHRDIKPANIMMAKIPEGSRVCIVDFGMVRDIKKTSSLTLGAKTILGTPKYMAPELIDFGKPDERTDIYSLGATMFHLLTGRPPFQGSVGEMIRKHLYEEPPLASNVGKSVPVELSRIVRRMMCKEAEARQGNAELVLADLEGFQAGPPNMVRIPAGEFIMGEGEDERRVHLKEYYIGKYPVTVSEYAEFIRENPSARRLPEMDDERFNAPDKPIVGINFGEAQAYCEWLSRKTGKKYRLPTEEEWEKAARGTDGRIYPWGNEFDKRKCNTSESGIEATSLVGAYPEGVSPHGCYDMVGNVWERTDSWYDKKGKKLRVLRGGSWGNGQVSAQGSSRGRDDPGHWFVFSGFRCARDT